MSLYVSGMGVDRYVLLGCVADGVFKELSDIFYKINGLYSNMLLLIIYFYN